MRKVKCIVWVSLFLFCLQAKAQISLADILKEKGEKPVFVQDIIGDAVRPALSIVRQQYRLERNGEYFGRGGKSYYGENFSLGVKISNFTLLQRSVVFPWERDKDYKQVNAGGKYQPDRFRSLQHTLADSVWNEVDFDFQNYTHVRTADSLLYESQDRISDFGLPVDETTGTKNGYMIWVYSTTNTQDTAMQVKLSQRSLTLDVKEDSLSISVNPEGLNHVLGGVFVVPQVERAGYITLSLVGVATLSANNDWLLELMVSKSDMEKTEEPTKLVKSSEKRKVVRRKKEKLPDELEPTLIK